MQIYSSIYFASAGPCKRAHITLEKLVNKLATGILGPMQKCYGGTCRHSFRPDIMALSGTQLTCNTILKGSKGGNCTKYKKPLRLRNKNVLLFEIYPDFIAYILSQHNWWITLVNNIIIRSIKNIVYDFEWNHNNLKN